MANTSGQPCRSSNTNLQNAEIKAVADYWRPLDFKHHCKKAGLEMLIELCGMKVPDGHSTRGELADILTRFCDGLPQNYHLTISELRTQVIWRNLLIEPHRTVNRAMCVRLLDQAEKSRTFPRFMDLPTELRELIYAFSLQPTMNVDRSYRFAPGPGPRSFEVAQNLRTALDTPYISDIRHFPLNIHGSLLVRVGVDLDWRSQRITAKVLNLRSGGKPFVSDQSNLTQAIVDKMRPTMDSFARDPGIGKLRTSDVEKLALSVSSYLVIEGRYEYGGQRFEMWL